MHSDTVSWAEEVSNQSVVPTCEKSATRDSLPKTSNEFKFVMLEGVGKAKVTFKLKSSGRPPTSTDIMGQGRHISAYSLMTEVVLTTIDGKNIKKGIEALDSMFSSYISTPAVLSIYKQLVDSALSQEDDFTNKSRRVLIEASLCKSREFFGSKSVIKFMNTLESSTGFTDNIKDKYDTAKDAVMAAKYIPAKEVRANLKSLDTHKVVQHVNQLISYTIKCFNKMDDIAFEQKFTFPPNLATAIAWLHPFPPGPTL